MKKLVLSLTSALLLVGSLAFASEDLSATQEQAFVLAPITAVSCDSAQATDANYCIMEHHNCPPSYERVIKYCWGGVHKRFVRCGYTCRKVGDNNGGVEPK